MFVQALHLDWYILSVIVLVLSYTALRNVRVPLHYNSSPSQLTIVSLPRTLVWPTHALFIQLKTVVLFAIAL